MKILLTVHQFFPEFSLGTERYTLALAKGLTAQGDEVTVLTVDLDQVSDHISGEPLREYVWDGVKVLAIQSAGSPIRRMSEHHSRPDRVGIYEEVLASVRPDLVHCCHLMNIGIEFLDVCKKFHVPVTATVTDLWGICWAGQMIRACDNCLCSGPDPRGVKCTYDFLASKRGDGKYLTRSEKRLAAISSEAVQRAMIGATRILPPRVRDRYFPDVNDLHDRNTVIAKAFSLFEEVFFPSRFLLEECEKFGLVRKGKGTLLPYGIRRPGDEEWKLLRAYPSKQGPVFAFVGQLARHKGLDLLLEAFVEANIPGATLDIFGKTNLGDPQAPELLATIEADDRMTYRGSFNGDDIYQILSGVDAVVIPSIWHENAPLVMLEALSAGRPVLVSKARGMVDFVREGETGYVFEMNSVEAIAGALHKFTENKDALQSTAMAEPGYRFTPEENAVALRATIGKHARTEPWIEQDSTPALVRFLRMGAAESPEFCEDPDGVGAAVIRSGLKGCELRIPKNPSQTEDEWLECIESIAAELKTTQGETNYGTSFPRLRRDHLLTKSHGKPYVSLWGAGKRALQLLKLPQSHTADFIRVCARPKNGRSAELKVHGIIDPLSRESIAITHRWNWSTKGWTFFELDLAALRDAFHELHTIEWLPMVERRKWKLDIASLQLRDNRFSTPPLRHRTCPEAEGEQCLAQNQTSSGEKIYETTKVSLSPKSQEKRQTGQWDSVRDCGSTNDR